MRQVYCFEDFCAALSESGFSMGGGSPDGIFSVIPWGWDEEAPYPTPVKWHTGIPETDPWEWRIRVLDERSDIAYAKLFFKKSGYITREWYPLFLAVRREGRSFDEMYEDGRVSYEAKRIYTAVAQYGSLPVHAIKSLCGFGREDKGAFDRALTELQSRMLLTICGRRQKRSGMGIEYGWSSTVLCTTEAFWEPEVFARAAELGRGEAYELIRERVLLLNGAAQERRIKRFIEG